jgi:hypothetical protein
MRWLKLLFEQRSPAAFTKAKRSRAFRPGIETLEQRQLLALISLAAPTPINPTGPITNAEPAFSWNPVAGADHYDVWVDDKTSKQTAVLRNQAITGTTWVPTTPLKVNDSYSWTVRAVDSTSMVFSPWSKSLDFTVSTLTAPAAIGPGSSVLSVEPTFTWNAVAGADHYDVWVNDKTSGQQQILRNQAVTGTSWTPATPLHPGDNYSWWVRAVDNSGANVSNWSVSLDFSVISLNKPTPVGPVGSTSSDTPTFTWSAVAGADHYAVWVNDLTTGQSAALRNMDVVGTSLAVLTPLTPGHSYRWWVRAIDKSGTNDGAWSAATDFWVTFLAWPVLAGPIGATTNDLPTLTWNAVAGADHYRVSVSDLTTGQAAVLQNQFVPGTSWTLTTSLRPGHTYRWWVQAVDGTSTATSPWSTPLDFTVSPLSAPTPLGPSATVASALPAFSWTAVAGADHYDIWIDDLTTGQIAVQRNRNVAGTTWTTTTALTPGDSYRWWVKGIDSTNTAVGPWSRFLDFTVSALKAPIVIGPSGPMTTAAPTFTWNAVTDADHYEIWVSDLTTGQVSAVRQQNLVGTSWTPTSPLHPGDGFRWWVRAADATNTNHSAWSGPLDFSVAILTAPALIGPSGPIANATPTFTWNTVAAADHYEIWVNDLTTGQSGLLQNRDIVTTSWTPTSALHAGDSYRWWVRAVDSSGGDNSAWSSPLSFSIPAAA